LTITECHYLETLGKSIREETCWDKEGKEFKKRLESGKKKEVAKNHDSLSKKWGLTEN